MTNESQHMKCFAKSHDYEHVLNMSMQAVTHKTSQSRGEEKVTDPCNVNYKYADIKRLQIFPMRKSERKFLNNIEYVT
jgi:hypothetical protein